MNVKIESNYGTIEIPLSDIIESIDAEMLGVKEMDRLTDIVARHYYTTTMAVKKYHKKCFMDTEERADLKRNILGKCKYEVIKYLRYKDFDYNMCVSDDGKFSIEFMCSDNLSVHLEFRDEECKSMYFYGYAYVDGESIGF